MSHIKAQIIKELHKPLRHKFQGRRVVVKGLGDILGINLTILTPLSKYNNGYNYILVVIDGFSKYLCIEPLKTKKGKEVSLALENILKKFKYPIKHIWADRGTEFLNPHVSALLERKNIHLYHTSGPLKCVFAERVSIHAIA